MPEFETPLENLFLYIRDIFGNPTTCTEFEKEKNNEKAKDINYWDIGSIYEIAKKAKQQNINEFEFALTSDLELLGNTLLTIKRVNIPVAPIPPIEIKDWIEINDYSNLSSTVSYRKQIDQTKKFEDSKHRITAFEKYKSNSENALFPITIPEILDGWIIFENTSIQIIPERVLKINFEEDDSRVAEYKRFETEHNGFYKEYEIPIVYSGEVDPLIPGQAAPPDRSLLVVV